MQNIGKHRNKGGPLLENGFLLVDSPQKVSIAING